MRLVTRYAFPGGACRAAGLLVFLSVTAAHASHYPLNSVDVTTSNENFSLFKAGVTDTEELLAQTATVTNRNALATKTGISGARLKELAQTCNLLSMKGIGPTVARLLTRCDVRTLRDLGRAQAVPLLECMKKVNLKEAITELLPDVGFLNEWIDHAKVSESTVE